MSIESDMAVIADLEAKGQAFLDALEASRPALDRLRQAAVRSRSTAAMLTRAVRDELDSSAVSEPLLDQSVDVARPRRKR
jgi:hypothetical protein